MSYEYFKLNIENKIATVTFNNPSKANALPGKAWEEMKAIFEHLNDNPAARVVILEGEGKHFCSGIDLALLMDLQKFQAIECEGRKREALRKFIFELQDSITAIEKCRKPVIAAIHGVCLGGGFDIAAACDMRYCTADAQFSIKEIDLGFVADIGILQRLPKVIPYAVAAELAYTGRHVGGQEATDLNITNKTYANRQEMLTSVHALAKDIASKSPLAIRGTKEMLQYTRDHSVQESLNYMTAWNASFLLTNDLKEAFSAKMMKKEAEFED